MKTRELRKSGSEARPRGWDDKKEEGTTRHKIGTREEWLAARLELLAAEKELTRRSDELARQRQGLPWVRIDKEYRFETDEGSAGLADLFRGRSQLLVYHFMFGPGIPLCATSPSSSSCLWLKALNPGGWGRSPQNVRKGIDDQWARKRHAVLHLACESALLSVPLRRANIM